FPTKPRLFGRKVARSRSVGCGSRSFSGDLLERISTGFGDCTLRRVESQREAKHSSKGAVMRGRGVEMGEHHHRIKEEDFPLHRLPHLIGFC
ncbi:Myristoylated alanine-rich c-kinase, partial [Thalictrum thalictroides]